MELKPVLEAVGLVRSYADRRVVDSVSVHVNVGEILAVLGPNGAGKSTLFRMLALVERPDAGSVRLRGEGVGPHSTAAIRKLGAVFQRPYLFRGSVDSNVGYGLRVRGITGESRRQRLANAMDLLSLGDLARSDVSTLSGGEIQRVALARALAVQPDVLVLDEPTANLDVTIRRRFREDLERIVRRAAGSVILITHDPTDAFTLADRIAIMEAGRIVQEGKPTDLILDPATPFVAAFTGAELLLNGRVTGSDGDLVTVDADGVVLVAAAREGGLQPGSRVHVGYRPEDVVITLPGAAPATSAVNRFSMTVIALVQAESLVRVRLGGTVQLTALVTRRSAEMLQLGAGVSVMAQVKATALRAFASS
jgi:molybdopterin-binding protein